MITFEYPLQRNFLNLRAGEIFESFEILLLSFGRLITNAGREGDPSVPKPLMDFIHQFSRVIAFGLFILARW